MNTVSNNSSTINDRVNSSWKDINKFTSILKKHEEYRKTTLNLIASENVLSPAVRSALDNDLLHRYADYPGREMNARRYRGNKFINELEQKTAALAAEVFRANFIEMRPLSGHLAGLAVILGLCEPNQTVLELGRDGGGHREAGRLIASKLIPLNVHNLAFDGKTYNINLAQSIELIEKTQPRMVILGSSNFLFPHPVNEIAKIVHSIPNSILVFDASHVMGFLAAGNFQDPLREGADIVFGSTHKTFPGPQGGIIFSERQDMIEAVSNALVPALVTNHHPFRMPALAMALVEMRIWGQAYTEQIVENSQRLGKELDGRGIPVVCVNGCYSASHTLLLSVANFGKAEEVAVRLETAGIMTTSTLLPEAHGVEGIRIGTQEITRLGATETHIPHIADLIADAIRASRPVESIAQAVRTLTRSLGPIHFTWGETSSHDDRK